MPTATKKKQSKPVANKTGTSTPAPENRRLPEDTNNNAPKALTKAQMMDMAQADSGRGHESTRTEDLAIPRINLLQSGSPQVKKSEGAYVKGAEEGDFFDPVANAILATSEDGFLFIPVKYQYSYIEWKPRSDGGGLVKNHGEDGTILSKTTRDEKTGANKLPNGHEIVLTGSFFGIVLGEDQAAMPPRQSIVSLSKTQFNKARKLNTLTKMLQVPKSSGVGTFNPPLWYSVFKVTSVPESNDKGNWMGWKFVRHCDIFDLPNGAELYPGCSAFCEAVTSGSVKTSPLTEDHTPAGGGGGEDDEEGSAL